MKKECGNCGKCKCPKDTRDARVNARIEEIIKERAVLRAEYEAKIDALNDEFGELVAGLIPVGSYRD